MLFSCNNVKHFKCEDRFLEEAFKDDRELQGIIGNMIGDPEEMQKKVRIFLLELLPFDIMPWKSSIFYSLSLCFKY